MILALAGVLVWVATPRDRAPRAAPPGPEVDDAGAAAPPGGAAPAEPTPPAMGSRPEPSAAGSIRRVGAARAAELRRAMARAHRDAERERRIAASPAPEAEAEPDAPAPTGTLPKEYIQDAVRDLKPLLGECYELALHEDGALQGRLLVEFWIVGDPELGGVVEDSQILQDESTLRHPVLDECIRETMYGLELPAPEAGGRMKVRYPFQFRREPEGPKPAPP